MIIFLPSPGRQKAAIQERGGGEVRLAPGGNALEFMTVDFAPLLPSLPGTYALLLALPHASTLDIGQLGRFSFPAGWYVYLGSARGPGGLRGRLSHHARPAAHPHWHIDYFRREAQLIGVLWQTGTAHLECRWARVIASALDCEYPAPRLGASDCACVTHLLFLSRRGKADGELAARQIAGVLRTSCHSTCPIHYSEFRSANRL